MAPDKHSHILRYWRLRASTYEFWGAKRSLRPFPCLQTKTSARTLLGDKGDGLYFKDHLGEGDSMSLVGLLGFGDFWKMLCLILCA